MTTRRDDAPSQRADLSAPATQLVSDRETYLGQGSHDIGRRLSDDQVELFIDTDVATALQQAFALHKPEFVALHDVGISASLRLLKSLAGAGGGRVQRLSVRRRGHGVALAVLQFVEMPLSDGRAVRAYATDVNADSQTRSEVGRVLLGHSRLGVLLVGELPQHVLSGQLAPLHAALRAGPWPNRDLLLLPLGSGTALAAQGAQLAADSAVAVHVTPQAARPEEAWSYIGGAWNRLHGRRTSDGALPTELALAVPKAVLPASEAPTLVMGLDPVLGGLPRSPGSPVAPGSPPRRAASPGTATRAPAPMSAPASTPALTPTSTPGAAAAWQAYAERCMMIKGSVACCVFGVPAMQPLAHAGNGPTPLRLAQQGTALLEHGNDMATALGMGHEARETNVSSGSHHALVRRVPGHAGVAVHLLLVAGDATLALARLQLDRILPPA